MFACPKIFQKYTSKPPVNLELSRVFNSLPDMPILGSSNSAANADMILKKYVQTGIQLSIE